MRARALCDLCDDRGVSSPDALDDRTFIPFCTAVLVASNHRSPNPLWALLDLHRINVASLSLQPRTRYFLRSATQMEDARHCGGSHAVTGMLTPWFFHTSRGMQHGQSLSLCESIDLDGHSSGRFTATFRRTSRIRETQSTSCDRLACIGYEHVGEQCLPESFRRRKPCIPIFNQANRPD